MPAEELAALSTIAGVAAAVLFGAAGMVVGIVGLVQARRARQGAMDANRIAHEANALSASANRLSEEANDIARDNAARADEQHDVDWEWDWDAGHSDMVTVQNIGKNRALGATVQFFYEDATEAAGPLDIEGRETIRLLIPGLQDDIVRERQRLAEVVAATSHPSFVGSVSWIPASIRTRLRVTWRTDLGTPKGFESGWETDRRLPT
jgi:hypothetical protein